MAIYAIFNVATQNRNLVDVRMRGFYVEKVYRGPEHARTRRHPSSTTVARETTVKPAHAHISHVTYLQIKM